MEYDAHSTHPGTWSPSRFELLGHALAWAALLTMANVEWRGGWGADGLRAGLLTPWEVLGFAGLFYLNLGLLFPRYFERRGLLTYVLAAGSVFGLAELLRALVYWRAAPLAGGGLAAELTSPESWLLGRPPWAWLAWLTSSAYGLLRAYFRERRRRRELAGTRALAELEALRARIDPHFLFNALNTLDALLPADAEEARAFTRDLARLYRARVESEGEGLVPLARELEVAASYVALMRVRFGDSFAFAFEVGGHHAHERTVVSGALLTALENVVKHNAPPERGALGTSIRVVADDLEVANALHPRASEASLGRGLGILDRSCRLLLGRPLRVERSAATFTVDIPLGRQSDDA